MLALLVLQDFQRALGQRHTVLLAALHALGRHRPGLVGEIDLRLLCAERARALSRAGA
jgi:hypothetical protein